MTDWWPWCTRCLVKHILLAEGHLGEAIDRCAREYASSKDRIWLERMRKYALVLSELAEQRKKLEEIYFSEEILA